MGNAYSLSVTFDLETIGPCSECGVVYAIPATLKSRRLEDGESFYCPNGHGQCYRESKVKKLQRQLAEQQRRTTEEWNRANAAETRAVKAERKVKRVEKGVCPHCKRSFQNLRRHMECKHRSEAGGGE